MKNYLLVLFVTTIFTGCSSTGPIYQTHHQVAEDKAQLVIFRPDTFFQGGIPYQISINGNKSASLRNGGYTILSIPPGETTIEVTAANWFQSLWNNPSLKLRTSPKDRVFIKVTPVRGNGAVIDIVGEENASSELKCLKESQ
jgi:hypothetical protein